MDNESGLANMLTAITPELRRFKIIHCQHSGKPCGEIPDTEISACVNAHGFEIAERLLQMKQKGVAAEWIWLNAAGLDKLALQQPTEYFIYAMGTILQPAIDEAQITNELTDFNQRMKTWYQLQSVDVNLIKPIAEIIRRLITKAPPRVLLNKLRKLTFTDMQKITESLAELTRFQLACEKVLQNLIEKPYTNSEERLAGFSTFRQQKRTVALSELETEIFNEFNDFEIIPDKKPEAIEAICGRAYGKLQKSKPKNAARFTGQLQTAPKTVGFKLNLTGNAK